MPKISLNDTQNLILLTQKHKARNNKCHDMKFEIILSYNYQPKSNFKSFL